MARMRMSLVAATATIAALAAPTTASAVSTGCDGLQSALDDPANSVVTLDEGAVCSGPWNLPEREILFEGGGTGATLSGDLGDGDHVQILSGDGVGATVIRNLTFRGGLADGEYNEERNGGAIQLGADSPVTIEGNDFFSNVADRNGGAVSIDDFAEGTQDLARGDGPAIILRDNTFGGPEEDGNVAGNEGGAVHIDSFRDVIVEDNRFFDNIAEDDNSDGGGLEIEASASAALIGNTFARNQAAEDGGGASVETCTAEITGNVFDSNRIVGENDSSVDGGGLYLDGSNCRSADRVRGYDLGAVATQSGNRFIANSIDANGTSAAGGGEHVQDIDVESTNDRFVGNVIEDVGQAYGGGLSFDSPGGQPFAARNLVAAGNRIVDRRDETRGQSEAPHHGGGLALYGNDSVVRVADSTIEGNSAAQGSGIAGEEQSFYPQAGAAARTELPVDTLILQNSIVYDNTGATDLPQFESDGEIDGFAFYTDGGEQVERDVRSSDACVEGEPHPDGDGSDPNSNICADPQTAGASTDENVDQVAGSPTVDAGDNSLVDADLTRDYAGDGRVLDGDADGTARVDMGADEYKPVTAEPTPTPTPAAQPAPQGAVQGQTQRSCVSRRSFRIRIRVPRGKKARSATVRVNNRKVRVVRGKRLRAPVVLRGLPKGRVTVRITVRLTNGKKITGKRVYHTCIPKLPGDGPPRV